MARRREKTPLDALDLPPLTARSVLGSALIGTRRGLSSRTLTSLAALFGIAPATSRVALSRMLAAGEVTSKDGRYQVAGPFRRRQDHQTASVESMLADWDGGWDLWIVRSTRRNAAERVSLRNAMIELRNAEYREGVWMRPSNLPDGLDADAWRIAVKQAERFSAGPHEEASALASSLWDLDAWASRANTLLEAASYLRPEVDAGSDTSLAPSFRVLVDIVHHFNADPLLPPELLPKKWPGPRLRAEFSGFEAAWQNLLADWRVSLGHPATES
jgi:phenylacetic acid degradation operon negative regulatory protein